MTIVPNSIEARDIAYQLHPNVNLRKYEKTGGLVIESGDGIYVTDTSGKRYIEGMAGLWSVALGWLVFSDTPSWSTLAGAVLIVASGLYILHRELKRAAMRRNQ